ncbi:MAG: signal peptide peptidase SppA [Anaerolineales bacterium]|nr:signal peptide peptidase SppA [Anaerolineales bacterium]
MTVNTQQPSDPVQPQASPWWVRLFLALDFAWRRFVCALFNARRTVFRSRLPDYAVFTIDTALLEREPDTPWYYTFLPIYTPPLSLEYLSSALARVAADPTLRGVVFLLKGAELSLAQAQSLAMLFDRFRRWDEAVRKPNETAKRVVVYLEEGPVATYVAASTADLIVMPPLAEWSVTGLLAEPTFFKDTLARVGVAFDVVRVAPWKTAVDSFSFSDLTDEARDQYNWLFDSLFEGIVDAVTQGRKLPPDTVRSLIDQAPLTAESAVAAGLIDHVGYEDQLPALLGTGAEPATLKTFDRIRRLLYRRARHHTPAAVGVISLRGSIMTGDSRTFPAPLPLLGEETIGSATAQQAIRQAREDERFAAVVIHVDSPGGSALASDLIWREIALLDQEKPVVVYMGDVAASGGYYVAAPGRKIIAQPATITGSIGVIVAKPIATAALEKLEVGHATIQRGANATLFSSLHPWEGTQRQTVESSMDAIYAAFKQRVADGRNLPLETLDDLAGGRVWTVQQALNYGLVDHLGDFHLAVELACQEAGLPTDGSVGTVNLSAEGKTILATPVQVVAALLGKRNLATTRQWSALLSFNEVAGRLRREHSWLIADGLPSLRN